MIIYFYLIVRFFIFFLMIVLFFCINLNKIKKKCFLYNLLLRIYKFVHIAKIYI